MQDPSLRNPVEGTFLMVKICVLPQVALWGKGMVATFGGHSIAFNASDYCLLTKSAFDRIFEDNCGFDDKKP